MTDTSSISAINKILKEERESRARIEACRHQAEKIIENGRYQARRISNRADERIGIVHARTDLGIARQLAELKQQMATLSGEPVFTRQDDPRLLAAIEALADELVGDAG